jgi:hypothetical protein
MESDDGHSSGPRIAARLMRPTRGLTSPPLRAAITGRTGPPLLFGLAPRGVYLASCVAARAVGSYSTVSPLPDASHEWRAAQGFASSRSQVGSAGGLFSVALSVAAPLKARPPGVTRRAVLWSPDFPPVPLSGTSGRPAHPPGSSIQVASDGWRVTSAFRFVRRGGLAQDRHPGSDEGRFAGRITPSRVSKEERTFISQPPLLLNGRRRSAWSRRLQADGRGIRARR